MENSHASTKLHTKHMGPKEVSRRIIPEIASGLKCLPIWLILLSTVYFLFGPAFTIPRNMVLRLYGPPRPFYALLTAPPLQHLGCALSYLCHMVLGSSPYKTYGGGPMCTTVDNTCLDARLCGVWRYKLGSPSFGAAYMLPGGKTMCLYDSLRPVQTPPTALPLRTREGGWSGNVVLSSTRGRSLKCEFFISAFF